MEAYKIQSIHLMDYLQETPILLTKASKGFQLIHLLRFLIKCPINLNPFDNVGGQAINPFEASSSASINPFDQQASKQVDIKSEKVRENWRRLFFLI